MFNETHIQYFHCVMIFSEKDVFALYSTNYQFWVIFLQRYTQYTLHKSRSVFGLLIGKC